MRTRRTLLCTLIPLLVLPALMLVSSEAEAKKLSISNGFRTKATFTTTGWTYGIYAEGVVTDNNAPTSIDLDCTIDETAETLQCLGILEIGTNSVDIRLDAGNNDMVRWGIDADAGTLFNQVGWEWGQEVTAREVAPGWSAGQIYFGSAWRWWYWITDWETEWESITGMPREELYVWEL